MNYQTITDQLDFPEGPIAMPDGSFIVVEIRRRTLSRVSADGEVSVIAELGGGPNGAAIGPDGHCYVCNNGGFEWATGAGGTRPIGQAKDYSGGRIDRVNLETGEWDTLYSHGGDVPLKGPNDIVFDKEGGFWFTDLGKRRDEDMDIGGVFYATIDGKYCERVIHPLITPNGIGLSALEDKVYVAETATGRVWSFDVTAPGKIAKQDFPSPNGGTLLAGVPGFQNFDSLAVDIDGNVCVATLMNGGITIISPDGSSVEHVPAPDIYTTNICFGGADLKTAYLTLSGSGKLVSTEWPTAGLPLNFLNK
jgi:gluconolactonase